MAKIIKREYIEIANGTLSRLCKKHKIKDIAELGRKINLNGDILRRFNNGKYTMRFETWEKICNYLDEKI